MSVERSALNVERSGSAGRAVFLSYASQDAEPARRICDALRAAGVEVWFDQSELRGGDAWDAKIRKVAPVPVGLPVAIRARRQFWPYGCDRGHVPFNLVNRSVGDLQVEGFSHAFAA